MSWTNNPEALMDKTAMIINSSGDVVDIGVITCAWNPGNNQRDLVSLTNKDGEYILSRVETKVGITTANGRITFHPLSQILIPQYLN